MNLNGPAPHPPPQPHFIFLSKSVFVAENRISEGAVGRPQCRQPSLGKTFAFPRSVYSAEDVACSDAGALNGDCLAATIGALQVKVRENGRSLA